MVEKFGSFLVAELSIREKCLRPTPTHTHPPLLRTQLRIKLHSHCKRREAKRYIPFTLAAALGNILGGFGASFLGHSLLHWYCTGMEAFLETWEQNDLILLALLYRRRKYKKGCSVRVYPILKTRQHYGEFHRLVAELRLHGSQFKDYFRLTTTQFENVLILVGPLIAKQDTSFMKAITPAERLAICLRYVHRVITQ